MTVLLVSQQSLGACNPSDIKKQTDGTYSYPVDCHIDYGRLRQVEEERKKQSVA